MSAKSVDKHNRYRSITVGFRVSPEENEVLNAAVALSGLPKQEYCYRRCMNRDVVVQGNPKVYKALKTQMAKIYEKLHHICDGKDISAEMLETLNLIAVTLNGMKEGRE